MARGTCVRGHAHKSSSCTGASPFLCAARAAALTQAPKRAGLGNKKWPPWPSPAQKQAGTTQVVVGVVPSRFITTTPRAQCNSTLLFMLNCRAGYACSGIYARAG